MASRDPHDLHPDLRERWEWMKREWTDRHSDAPRPFLTCTYRPPSEQEALVAEGRSNAAPGRSLHNFEPALAFDVAFHKPEGGVTWEFHWFEMWGELAEEAGLQWGGRWANLVDGPHVQWPTTWRAARAGKLPPLPPLPGENPLLQVSTLHIMRADGTQDVVELDPVRPARVVDGKLYVNEPK